MSYHIRKESLFFWMCLLMTYTELVATDNGRTHPNIEFTHQIKVCYYLKTRGPEGPEALT